MSMVLATLIPMAVHPRLKAQHVLLRRGSDSLLQGCGFDPWNGKKKFSANYTYIHIEKKREHAGRQITSKKQVAVPINQPTITLYKHTSISLSPYINIHHYCRK